MYGCHQMVGQVTLPCALPLDIFGAMATDSYYNMISTEGIFSGKCQADGSSYEQG